MKYSSIEFECSNPDLATCPEDELLEFAFIGRSNVGKSSLLNMLSMKRALARVSAPRPYKADQLFSGEPEEAPCGSAARLHSQII